MLSTDCSPTASSGRDRFSLSGLPNACRKLCARPDIPADLVGLLIAAIGFCDSVTDDRRLLTTRGEGGTDEDTPADGGPEPVDDDVRPEYVRSAASLGRRAERCADDLKLGT